MLNKDKELEFEIRLVRMEEKIDHLIELLKKQNGTLVEHDKRLRDLEAAKNKLFGIGVSGLIAGISALIKSFFKLF
jgi:wobble nucleotide-excising tRNase